MKITIKEAINTGFQKTHCLTFTGFNGQKKSVDLFENEFKELIEQINQYFGTNKPIFW